MTQLNVPGAQTANTWPHGVNTSAQVVGYYVNTSGATVGFLYAGGKYTTLSYPGATGYTRASGINDSGTVVGDYQVNGDNVIHSYTYDVKTKAYTPYPDVNGSSTSLYGVNNAGDKAGAAGGNGVVQGFVEIGGAVTRFYANGNATTFALAINSSNEAVGEWFESNGHSHGFSRTPKGAITEIDYPGGTNTVCFGINDAGEITGSYLNSSGLSYGFTYIKGQFATTDFAGTRGINNKGAYDGVYWGVDGVQQAYLAVPQAFKLSTVKVPKNQQALLWGVNNSNVTVGNYVDSNGTAHGMMISAGKVKNIDDPKGVSTTCFGINTAGKIVGAYFDSGGNPHGFQYGGGKFTDIPGPAGSVASLASGINDSGKVAGFFVDSIGHIHGFVLAGSNYTVLDVPGANGTLARGINKAGLVTLQWFDSVGYTQSSLYNGKKFVSVNVPGAAVSQVQAINKAGDIVYFWSDPYGVGHGALKKGSSYFVFDYPKGSKTGAGGINDSDLMVGSYTPAGKTAPQAFQGTE